MAKLHVTTTINGDEVEFLARPDQTLLSALRDELTAAQEDAGDERRRRTAAAAATDALRGELHWVGIGIWVWGYVWDW